MARLKGVITRRILKMLKENANRDNEKYNKWYKDFFQFLKEGLATDEENRDALMDLQRFDANF